MSKYPPVHCPKCGAPSVVKFVLSDKNLTKFQCLPPNPSNDIHEFWKKYPPKEKQKDDAETSQLEIL